MRFTPEAGHGANAGLAEARKRLEPIKAKHPNVRESPAFCLSGAREKTYPKPDCLQTDERIRKMKASQ
jgi:hypothetical protein